MDSFGTQKHKSVNVSKHPLESDLDIYINVHLLISVNLTE